MEAVQLCLVAEPRSHLTAVAPLLDEVPSHRMRSHGPAALSDAEVISIITGGSMEEARGLVCGGLRALSQSDARFAKTEGALRVAAALELGRRIAAAPWAEPATVRRADDIARGLIARYGHQFQEHFVCVFLNSRNQVLHERVVYKGTMTSALVATREPIALALQLNAVGIIACHNHASGDPSPSDEDVRFTRNLYDACQLMGIELLDHVIVSPARYASMKERGHFPETVSRRFA